MQKPSQAKLIRAGALTFHISTAEKTAWPFASNVAGLDTQTRAEAAPSSSTITNECAAVEEDLGVVEPAVVEVHILPSFQCNQIECVRGRTDGTDVDGSGRT